MNNYNTIWVFLTHLIQSVIFSVSYEEVLFTRFMADCSDFSVFLKLIIALKIIRESKLEASSKLPVTLQVVANFLILLITLIARLPKPIGFKCNLPFFSSFEVIFPFSMISICKPCKF